MPSPYTLTAGSGSFVTNGQTVGFFRNYHLNVSALTVNPNGGGVVAYGANGTSFQGGAVRGSPPAGGVFLVRG